MGSYSGAYALSEIVIYVAHFASRILFLDIILGVMERIVHKIVWGSLSWRLNLLKDYVLSMARSILSSRAFLVQNRVLKLSFGFLYVNHRVLFELQSLFKFDRSLIKFVFRQLQICWNLLLRTSLALRDCAWCNRNLTLIDISLPSLIHSTSGSHLEREEPLLLSVSCSDIDTLSGGDLRHPSLYFGGKARVWSLLALLLGNL